MLVSHRRGPSRAPVCARSDSQMLANPRTPVCAFTAVFRFTTPQNLGLLLGPGERAVLEMILQNARGQGWADRAFLSFHGAYDFSTTDDFRF
jgi:hypothetical protein